MRAGRLGAVTLAAGLLTAGCTSHQTGPVLAADVPGGGVDAGNRNVKLVDAWIEAPQGVPAGGSAGLRITLANHSLSQDALLSVSSPIATHASLSLNGATVSQIPLPPQQARNLEWGQGSGIELTGFRRPLGAGQWTSVTLTFASSPSVTMQVVAGPLAATSTPAVPSPSGSLSPSGSASPSSSPSSSTSPSPSASP